METTSAIKRPILVKGSKVVCFGYDAEKYDSLK
jgi:arsenate reductase-like glutaredoxin family protein